MSTQGNPPTNTRTRPRTNARTNPPTNQPTATATGYVSGWHSGPTPQRCTGGWTSPRGDFVACTHPAHREDPQPVSNPVHEESQRRHAPGDARWREDRQAAFRLETPAGVLLTPAEPESDLWFQQRRGGITATDLPKILDLSEYGNALSVWLDKRGEAVPDELGEAGQWGNLLEDTVAREWARRRGVKVRRIGVLRNAEQPWMRASLDRRVIGCPEHPNGCALEVKTRSAYVAGRWRDDVPDDVYTQATWQRLVSGLQHVHVAVLLGGQRLVQHVVGPDEDVEKLCQREAGDVWQLVGLGMPPHVQPTALLTKLLDSMHVTREGTVEIPGDRVEEVARLLDARRDALARVKVAESDADAAKAGLVQLLGGGEVAVLDGRELYRYRTSTRRSTGWKDVLESVREQRPDVGDLLTTAIAANTRTTTVRSMILGDAA